VAAVQGLDTAAVLPMDAGNLDSPECAAVFLALCARLAQTPRLLEARQTQYFENGAAQAGSFMCWTAE
jgi:hypothetical protein